MDGLWIALGIAVVWAGVVGVNRLLVRRVDGSGDAGQGIVVFVEPIRWLFVIWAITAIGWGLRRARWKGRIVLFRWCSVSGSLLVLPDLMRHRWLQGKADELAALVDTLAAEHPGQPIHLIGYSNGCYLSVEAAKRVRNDAALGRLVLLAGAISRAYSLGDQARRVYNFHSPLDVISGAATHLFGSSDRHWGHGSGTAGFADPNLADQHGWRPRDMRHGYFGDHFTLASPWFAAHHVAPILQCRDDAVEGR